MHASRVIACGLQMDWMLPGIPPTHRKVAVPFVVSIDFEGDKVAILFYIHICINDIHI